MASHFSRHLAAAVSAALLLTSGAIPDAHADEPAAESPPGKIAVFLAGTSGTAPELASSLTELIIATVAARGMTAVGSSEFRTAMGATDAEALGCGLDPLCLGRAGRKLGVPRVLFGTVGASGSGHVVTLNLVSVETGKVVGRASETVPGGAEGLLRAIPDITAKAFEPAVDASADPVVVVKSKKRNFLLPAISGGGSLAVAVTASVFLGLSVRTIPRDMGMTYAKELRDNRQVERSTSIGLFIGAGVLAAVTVVLFVVAPVKETTSREDAPAAAGPGGVTILRW